MKDKSNFALRTPFIPTCTKQHKCNPSGGYWFIFKEDTLLVQETPDTNLSICTEPPDKYGFMPLSSRFFGYHGTIPCSVVEVGEGLQPDSTLHFHGLRVLLGRVDEELFKLAGRAIQVLRHQREHRFCSRCGTPMNDSETELAKICPSCHFTSFPRITPAVIMSVVRDDCILLGRAPRFPLGMYSTLAGFVESGETLEEAVRREVLEETAIHVRQIRYVTSQPWPFPHSLMVGFNAIYQSGKIKIDTNELEDAQWFPVADLPKIPSKNTIARLLIDAFVSRCS